MNEFLSEHVNPESVTSFVDNSGRDNVIMQYEEAAAEAESEDVQEQDRLADVLARLARLQIFAGIVANLNRGGTAKLRTEEEVNAAPFFTEDLAEIERFLKEEACQTGVASYDWSPGIIGSKEFFPVLDPEETARRYQKRVLSAQVFLDQHKELK